MYGVLKSKGILLVSMKYMKNEIILTLLIISSVMAILSTWFMAANMKKFITVYRENVEISVAFPFISRQGNAYKQDEYLAIQQSVPVDLFIKVDVAPDKIILSAPIDHEKEWRRAILEILAFDRNLHAIKVCGSTTNACSGAALVAELAGQHQRFFILN